jgi:hypothetical protein
MRASSRDEHQKVPQDLKCANCGDVRLRRRPVEDRFLYGQGKESVWLTAVVDAIECQACGAEYLSADAEDARQAVVYQHVTLLLPEQIRSLHEFYKINLKEFAELTEGNRTVQVMTIFFYWDGRRIFGGSNGVGKTSGRCRQHWREIL